MNCEKPFLFGMLAAGPLWVALAFVGFLVCWYCMERRGT